MSTRGATTIEPPGGAHVGARPLVVMYLYVHEPGESFAYPSARTAGSAGRLAARYLECALAQAGSLRLRGAECDIALASNTRDRTLLGAQGSALLDSLGEIGVSLLHAPYEHRPGDGSTWYAASRYVLDAITSAAAGQPPDRPMWLTDLDCVWPDPARAFAALPPEPEIGCVLIDYPPDWDTVGLKGHGTRREVGELSASLGGEGGIAPWVGGELLAGSSRALLELVAAAERTDAELAERGITLPMEEQLLSLMAALGRIRARDLSAVARRVQTGRGHHAEPTEGATELGLWHLPGEKGLSLRRAAREIARGRTGQLRSDLADPRRAAQRFNVAGAGPARRLRDGAWIVGQRVAGMLGERG